MKIFVSWSGDRGRRFAEALCNLLAATDGDTRLEPRMSTQIRQGRPWATELLVQLGECHACIVCVTADTITSHWLAFEAGAVLGAGADPDHVVCLGLDLEPGMLDGHLLARFRSFDASAEGVRGLWKALRPGTDPVWSESAWQKFERELAAVPDATPKPLTIYLDLPTGLTAHPIQIDHDISFDDVLAKLLEWRGEHLDARERADLRCLDFDAERWLPMPWRLSTVGVRRLAVLHSEAVRRYQDSPRLASIQLREGIDVIPKVDAAMASLRRDLRDLMAIQASFHAEHRRYAESLAELDFLPALGNHIEMVAGRNGFAAVGRSDEFDGFGVRVGDGAGQFEGQPDGEPFLLHRA